MKQPMVNLDKLVSAVIGNTGGAYASRVFRLDTVDYGWAADFRRDQDLRAEIDDLKAKIIEAGKALIHRDELKAQFKGVIKEINAFRIRQITAQLASAQNREQIIFNERFIGERKVLGSLYLPYPITLSASEIDSIFSELPEGVKQQEIDANIAGYRERIQEIEGVIEKELSPSSRWFFQDNGKPIAYPQGCRWRGFFDVWAKVQARFEGPVTINGTGLKTDGEFMAYRVLGLDKVVKLPPLRAAYK